MDFNDPFRALNYIDPVYNVDPRRKQERADARRISEDHNAMANLSPKVINEQVNAFKFQERLAMYDQSDWRTK